jgi:hypothetical protein
MLLKRLTTATLAAQLLLGGAVLLAGELAYAQTVGVATAKTAPSLPGRPLWMDLSESQQLALAPLAQLWPTMTEPHKRKWLAVSQNFGQLSADEQTTVQGRMREWAALSPQQRSAARLNYADAQQQTQPVKGAAPAAKPVPPAKLATLPAATNNKALPRIASDQAAPTTLLPTPVTSSVPATSGSESSVTTPQ